MRGTVVAWLPGDFRARIKPALVRAGYFSRPSFLILGGVKCGSTALHHYLCDHPQIIPAWDKEVHFFDRDVSYLDRGTDWYHSKFPPPYKLRGDRITFEATPNYLYHYRKCAERIHLYDSGLKLIVLLREPVERAYSFWNMLRIFAQEGGKSVFNQSELLDPSVEEECRYVLAAGKMAPFGELVRRELETIHDPELRPELSFVRPGLYAEQIEHYLEYFPREQLLILESRSLLHAPRRTLNRVTEFLGLRRHEWSAYLLQKVNSYPYRDAVPPAIAQELKDFFRPHNERLYNLLGSDLGW
jgi:hypothetical protein